MATAAVTWLQISAQAVLSASASITESSDSLAASAVAVPVSTARVSWLSVSVPVGPVAAAAITEASDALTASAAMGSIAATARVSWLAVGVDGRVAAAAIADSGDTLQASAYAADPRIAGVWSPALLSRWWVLDNAVSLAVRTASAAIVESGDALAASAQSVRSASASIIEGDDALAAQAVMAVIRTAVASITEDSDSVDAVAVRALYADAAIAGDDDSTTATATVLPMTVGTGMLAQLAAEHATLRAASGLFIGSPEVLMCAIQATRFYAGWATMTDAIARQGPFFVTGATTVTTDEWAIIAPLFRLYVERESAVVVEASRGMGIEQVGRSYAEVAADIAQLEEVLPQKAYVEEVWSVGLPDEETT